MNNLPTYSISEEVVLQALEVCFKQDKMWQVSFTNPTAGPWKTIKFGDYVTGKDLRYAKEEDRPDIILFSESYSLFLILEAKDNIQKLLSRNPSEGNEKYKQLKKSIDVFVKEARRIDLILGNEDLSRLVYRNGKKDYNIIPGYIFPEPKRNKDLFIKSLFALHAQLSNEIKDTRIKQCLSFIIRQDDKCLTVYYQSSGLTAETTILLKSALPIKGI